MVKRLTRRLSREMEHHRKLVSGIAQAVRQFYDRSEPFRISHGSTNSTRVSSPGQNVVDTSGLKYVLEVDTDRKVCLVEPNVPMDRLVETTLKYNLVPLVVMEFPGITVGGGYAGTSGESSSFKHGFFDRTVNHVEMVLADGEVVTASENERADLFRGAAGAVGSLGVVTLVELRLQRASRYVKITYHPITSFPEAVETTQRMIERTDLDFLDGVLFSKDQGTIITGSLTDEAGEGLQIQTFSGAWDPWFYLHVQETTNFISKTPPVTELIPLEDYYFRYDRGGFWVGRSAFTYMATPFNRITRWLLDDFLRTRMMYKALHASSYSQQYVTQDLVLPFSSAVEFLQYADEAFRIYPLWLCPLKQSPSPTMHPHNAKEADGKALRPMLNVGLWGFGPRDREIFVALNRHLERILRELGGMKWLYAQTHYSEDEFWGMFERDWYEALRRKYHATTLPNVYDKVKTCSPEPASWICSWWRCFTSTRPFGGFWGIFKALQSREYLAARRSTWKSIEAKEQKFG